MWIVRVLDKMSTINCNSNKVSFFEILLKLFGIIWFYYEIALHVLHYFKCKYHVQIFWFHCLFLFWYEGFVKQWYIFIYYDSLWLIWWLVLNYLMKIPFLKLNVCFQIKKKKHL